MQQTVIVDLDGTICDNEHRNHFIQGKRRSWDRYFLACSDDLPKTGVIAVVNALHQAGYHIHIFSGRGEIARENTEQWLSRYQVKYHQLTMRPQRDTTPDQQLKFQWTRDHGYSPGNVLCILDDRQKVVDMWRANGFLCMQVAPGDF